MAVRLVYSEAFCCSPWMKEIEQDVTLFQLLMSDGYRGTLHLFSVKGVKQRWRLSM